MSGNVIYAELKCAVCSLWGVDEDKASGGKARPRRGWGSSTASRGHQVVQLTTQRELTSTEAVVTAPFTSTVKVLMLAPKLEPYTVTNPPVVDRADGTMLDMEGGPYARISVETGVC